MHDLKRPADNKITSQYGFIAFKKESEAIRAKKESGENPAIQALFVQDKPYVQFWMPKSKLTRQKEMARQ